MKIRYLFVLLAMLTVGIRRALAYAIEEWKNFVQAHRENLSDEK